jgi:thiosulfate dehydrogenase (quinone) large subunit
MKNTTAQFFLGLTRLTLGWIFFWAFIDKVFGLGFGTKPEQSLLNGSSPTMGFLKFATKGPFSETFQSMAGNPLVDFLFMAGLLGIGIALILGIGIKIAGYSGALMMLLMYAAVIPPQHNPLVDDHIVYALLLLSFPHLPVGEWLGFGKIWSKTKLVKSYPILR